MEKIKILFLINTLGGGGAEKVLVNLVNNIDTKVFDITVETMFSGGVNQKFLNPNIRYICKNAFTIKGISHIYKFLPSKYLYNKFIGNEKYDILVAYMHNLPTKVITGCPDDQTKKIGWLHCGTVERDTYCTCWFTKEGANKSYNKCDALVGVSKKVVSEFKQFFDINTSCQAVYNTNDTALIEKKSKETPSENIDDSVTSICTVGRLSYEKGNDRLIEASILLLKKGYNFNVYFIGDGAEKERLINSVKESEFEKHFHFLGFQKNPYAIVNRCNIFVCPSRVEGFSTAVTEAVVLGKPVISTDVSGAKEILGDSNEYGLVVENSTEGIVSGIEELLSDPQKMTHYEKAASIRAVDFQTKKTVKNTEELFLKVLNK